MNITVGTDPVHLDVAHDATPLIQNLGSGNLYIEATQADCTTTSGLKLAAGDIYQYPLPLNEGAGDVWLVADAAGTDVRYLVVG